MEAPKFLIADNSEFPEKMYVLHTDFPRFLLDIETGEIDIYEEFEEEPDVDLESELAEIIEQAFDFFDKEMESYEE